MPSFIYKDKLIQLSVLLSAILLIIGFSTAFVRLADAQHLLIIHFDSYQGIDFLGAKSDVFKILLVGIALSLINIILSEIFYQRERFFSYLLIFSNVLVSLLILLTIFVIVSVN